MLPRATQKFFVETKRERKRGKRWQREGGGRG